MGNTYNPVNIWCCKYGENRYCERCANKKWCASKHTGLLNSCLGKLCLHPYLVVPLISARVTLISTRVSTHCQAILLQQECSFEFLPLATFMVDVNPSKTWIMPKRLSDIIWWHRSGSPLAQVIVYCLMAPSHYLNECWHLISEVLWHSPESNFTVSAQGLPSYYYSVWWVLKIIVKITATSSRGKVPSNI